MDRDRLKRDVERIEAHRREKAAIAKSEREIYAALKSDGYDCKVVREIIKRRGMDDSDGWDAEVATYEAAVRGLRHAAEAVRAGATYEEAAVANDVRKADLHHYVQATGGVPDNDIPEHDPITGEVEVILWEGGIKRETGSATRSGDGLSDALSPDGDIPAGQDACNTGETTETVEVGAVGSDSDRVASPELFAGNAKNDGLDIPEFLRRTPASPSSRGVAGDGDQ